MEQAGINTVQLIENKELFVLYNDSRELVQISSGGNYITIDGSFPKNLNIQENRSRNGDVVYNYDLQFVELDFEKLNKIKKSVYGFVPVLKMTDGTERVLLTPLNFKESNQDNNVSASYSVNLTNFVRTGEKIIRFNPAPIPWILETGFWDDTAYWRDDKIWID